MYIKKLTQRYYWEKKANEQYILNKPKGTVVITVAFTHSCIYHK